MVSTASRMESQDIPASIQVTERAYRRLASSFTFIERGEIEVKGKGVVRTHLLTGRPSAGTATS